MKTIEELKRLNKVIINNEIGKAKEPWGGADVAVVIKQPRKSTGGFYPDPFFVVSQKFSLEISWMFEQLRDAFYAEDLIDGCSKIEFFGRLARAANRGIFRNNEDCQVICMEILKEAQQIYGEITSNSFEALPIGTGNVIADDLKEAYIGSFEDLDDIVSTNFDYFMGNKFKDYRLSFEFSSEEQEKIDQYLSNNSKFPLRHITREEKIKGIEKEYFLREEIIHKNTGNKLSLYICRTNALYSEKTKLFREKIKSEGLVGVITLKNKFFAGSYNCSFSLVIFGDNPTTKFFSSANSFEELYNLIFEKEKYTRTIFYCDENDVNYDNLLPENYDSRKISLNNFLGDFEPKKLEDIAEIIIGPSASRYEFVESGIPYYTAASIQKGELILTNKFIAKDNVDKFAKTLVQEGDILITRHFNQKKIAIVKKENLPGIASNMLFIIRPYEDLNFDLFEYLSTGAGSKIFKRQLDSISTGVAISSINKKDLSSLSIPIVATEKKEIFENAYKSKFENVHDLADKILLQINESKVLDVVYDTLRKEGWKQNEISKQERFKYADRTFVPDFTLFSDGKPFAFVEVKGIDFANREHSMTMNQLKTIQKENDVLAIIALGGMYFEVYKFIDGEYKVYKFISNAPSKEDLIKIYREAK